MTYDSWLLFSPVSEVVSPDSGAPLSPPVIISPIHNASAKEGESVRFQCRVSGDGMSHNDILCVIKYFTVS